jgi:hypothetical protein
MCRGAGLLCLLVMVPTAGPRVGARILETAGMEPDDREARKLNDDEEMVVQDVRIAIGEYEAHCIRCVLTGTISGLPFDATKNELIRNFARSRNVKL